MGLSGLAPRIASAEPSTGWLSNPLTGISMFDCPEQNHTSPMSMSFSTTASPSEISSEYGPPASGVAILVSHFPSAEAVTDTGFFAQEALTVTLLPGSAFPQRAASVFCWSTMLSPITEGSVIFASSENVAMAARAAAVKILVFIMCPAVS